MQIMSLQKTVDHLEDRLSETLYRLSNIENASTNKSVSRSAEPGVAQYEFIAQPSALLNYPLRDEGACLEGWQLMEGFCFLIETKKKTFKEAISSCASKKAQLVSLTEAKKNLFIRKILNSDIKYWTSGTDIFSPTQWSFLLSGDPIPKEMWANPFKGYMNSRINHHCALIAKNGLEAINCGHKFSYICEKL
ncbi:hypothetical protein Avbf_07900 [Armadillidium vulgare]|nr:hypothetical protein Avbf_07900 [Armadillidium vulgare]